MVADEDIYRRVEATVVESFFRRSGEYVNRGLVSLDGLIASYRYGCMATDVQLTLVPIYRSLDRVVILRGNVEADLVLQLDKFGIPEQNRRIKQFS